MGSLLEDSLVEFFRRTTVSSAIVKKLASESVPIPRDDLLQGVASMMTHLLPEYSFAGSASNVADSLKSFEPTVETGLGLLIDAGIVRESEGSCRLTDVGLELHAKLAG